MYFCGSCKQECSPQPVNNGLGRIEAWGAIFHDDRPDFESACCNDSIYEDEECTIEASYREWAQNIADERADYEYEQWKDREID